MLNKILIYKTHYSIGSSLFTLEKETEINPNKPVSLLAVAKQHGLKQIIIAEDNISSFWKAHVLFKEANVQLIYGVSLTLCDNLSIEKDGMRTNGDATIWLKNDKAYFDFVKIYTEASTIGLHEGKRRITWARLNELWSDNFEISLPFYSSFIAQNTLQLFHSANPNFGKLKPTIFLADHNLPFDSCLRGAALKFASSHNLNTLESKEVRYYKPEDAYAAFVMRCILNRSTAEKPNLDSFSSRSFSFLD